MKFDNRNRRRVVLAALGIVAVSGGGWTVYGLVSQARADADALRVYCLAPERHEKLVDAADALDLAKREDLPDPDKVTDHKLPLEEWSELHPDDFDEACEALSGAERPRSNSTFATVLPFLTALVGAGGAFALTAWRDRVTRGQGLADDLRTATGLFSRAVEDYLTNWRPGSSDTELVATRTALATQVSRAKAARPGWKEIRQIEAVLRSGELGQSITTGWQTAYDATAANESRRAALRRQLAATCDDLFGLADRLQRPMLVRSDEPAVADDPS